MKRESRVLFFDGRGPSTVSGRPVRVTRERTIRWEVDDGAGDYQDDDYGEAKCT